MEADLGAGTMHQINHSSRRGFTLIEVLVTLAIMSSLLAIAVPQFITARDNSAARTCQHNLKSIMGAKERWAMDLNKGPLDTPTMFDLTHPTAYLRFGPECPAGGVYAVGRLDQNPTCSIGGPVGDRRSHIIQ
jgi:prepilin-type N-terminal cleavage/methylation domain-containing protein